jgi:hypothetical protein
LSASYLNRLFFIFWFDFEVNRTLGYAFKRLFVSSVCNLSNY